MGSKDTLQLIADTRYYLYRWSNHMLIDTYVTLEFAKVACRMMGYEKVGLFDHVPVAYIAADHYDTDADEVRRVIVFNLRYPE